MKPLILSEFEEFYELTKHVFEVPISVTSVGPESTHNEHANAYLLVKNKPISTNFLVNEIWVVDEASDFE